MDTFNPHSNTKNAAIIRDILTKNASSLNYVSNEHQKVASQVKDNVSLSQDEFVKILDRVKSENITDFLAIKDAVSFKDIQRFDYNTLTDSQIENLLSVIRGNISNTLSDFIYNKRIENKKLEISALEKNHLDMVLGKIRDSQITNLIQGIDFIKKSSNSDSGLFRKISQNLVAIIIEKEKGKLFLEHNHDSFSEVPIANIKSFTNPFGITDNMSFSKPITQDEAVDYLDSVIKADRKKNLEQNINPDVLSKTTNILTSYYLNNKNTSNIQEEAIKGTLQRITTEDQVWYKDNILHKNVSFLNSVAAKVAADKAKTIITSRLVGEIGGSSIAALSTAYLTGASPMLGIIGSFVLTMISAVVGMLIGKVTGEELGKLLTGVKLDDINDYENSLNPTQDNNQNSEHQKENEENSKEENSDESTEDSSLNQETEDNSPFSYINKQGSKALRNISLFKYK